MNFFDYLANPTALIDKDAKWVPRQDFLTHPDQMFSRTNDQTGAGKPGLQSFARNLTDASLGTGVGDYLNTHVLGDQSVADRTAYENRYSQLQPNATSSNPALQSMIDQWMQSLHR